MSARLFIALTIMSAGAQGQTAKQLRTTWGEPDLQGIWNGETLTPLQRPARFANKPVLTPEEAAKIEAEVASRPGRNARAQRGMRLADRRTSLIIDPPDGKIPPLTPVAQKRKDAVREYMQALLQGTSGG